MSATKSSPTAMTSPPSGKLIPGFEVAAQYYDSLKRYLEKHTEKGQTISQQRQNARDKLNRLSKPQFQELATDVYDEMTRRQFNSADMPFLPVRDDFHPKRNQARQKLATLPKNRFKDLASDVFFELERRFPLLLSNDDGDGVPAQVAVANPIPIIAPPTAVTSATVPIVGIDKQLSPNFQPQSFPAVTGLAGPNIPSDRQNSFSNVSSNKQNSTPYFSNNLDQRASVPESSINFSSLDALMADLGDMIAKPGEDESIEKVRVEYESKISALNRKISLLEAEVTTNRPSTSTSDVAKIQQLEDQLRNQQSMIQKLESSLKLSQNDYRKLQEDYQIQQEAAEDVRKEAAALLNEIKDLSDRNDDLLNERDKDKELIRKLSDENQRYQAQIRQLQSQLKNIAMKETSSSSPVAFSFEGIDKDDTFQPREDGAIEEGRISTYENAVDSLREAARSDVPTDVLLAMKSIVIACKSITEDVESYESRSTMSMIDREKLLEFKSELSACLTALMTAAKSHATGATMGRDQSVQDLNDAADSLTRTIIEIVRLTKIRKVEAGGFVGSAGMNQAIDGKSLGMVATDRKSMSVDELKVYLEKQTDLIVQAIQSLLYAMRQSTFGQDFQDTINGITSIVENLVEACRSTFNEVSSAAPYKNRGEAILKDLTDSNSRLADLGDQYIREGEARKPSKQKLASASYEVAKFTKELVSLFD